MRCGAVARVPVTEAMCRELIKGCCLAGKEEEALDTLAWMEVGG